MDNETSEVQDLPQIDYNSTKIVEKLKNRQGIST